MNLPDISALKGAPQLFEKFKQEAAELGLAIDDICGANGNGRRQRRGRAKHPRQEA